MTWSSDLPVRRPVPPDTEGVLFASSYLISSALRPAAVDIPPFPLAPVDVVRVALARFCEQASD
jgi:hypothetical protein